MHISKVYLYFFLHEKKSRQVLCVACFTLYVEVQFFINDRHFSDYRVKKHILPCCLCCMECSHIGIILRERHKS